MNHFNNVIIGQKAFIINKDNKILILKRQKVDINKGLWDVPGGKAEEDENLLTSIKREIKEETNLKLSKIILILSSSKFIGTMGDKPLIVRNIYLCKATGDIKISQEHNEYKWVRANELEKYKFAKEKDIQNVIKKLPGIIKKINLSVSYSQTN